MKKFIYILALVMIMASCSNQRYAHLNKVKSDHRSEKMQATGKKYPAPILIESKSSAVVFNSNKFLENAEVKFSPSPSVPSSDVASATKPVTPNEHNKKSTIIKAEVKKKATEVNKKRPFDHYARKDSGEWDLFSIIGFVAVFLGWLLPLTLLWWILAIVFSAIGLSRTKGGSRRGRGLAIAGLILGILSILLFLVLVVLLAAILL